MSNMKFMKNNKASGIDGTFSKLTKEGGETILELLLLDDYLHPDEWKNSLKTMEKR